MTSNAKHRLSNALQSWLRYRAGQKIVPGFSVAISLRGKPIFAEGFGFADFRSQSKMDANHQFFIGSQSKMFTAIIIMQLVEEYKLKLDDLVSSHLDWVKLHPDVRMQQCTIEHLLWHGSGLSRDGYDADFWQGARPFPNELALRNHVLNCSFTTAPGERVKYSNVGYALLGQIIEQVTGNSFHDELMLRITKPLGMHQTWVDRSDKQLATSYSHHISGQRYEFPATVTNTYNAVTGVISTPSDMLILMRSLYLDSGTQVLTPQLKQMMLYGQRHHWTPAESGRNEYNLGFIQQKLGNRTILGHGGGFLGFRSCSYFDPEAKIGISIAANSADTPVNHLFSGIHRYVMFFLENDLDIDQYDTQKFEGIFGNLTGTRQVMAAGKKIISVDPGFWSPFDTTETLSKFSENELTCVDGSFLSIRSDILRYSIDDGVIDHINYAGLTLYPLSLLPKQVKRLLDY